MKLQRQIAKVRVELTLPVALCMAANGWGITANYIDENGRPAKMECTLIDKNYLAQTTHATVVNTLAKAYKKTGRTMFVLFLNTQL